MRKEEKQKVKEKGKQPQLNAEFQKIAKRDNKAFLNKQCKETEENNRMEKTRDVFKKIRDTKGAIDGINKGQKWYGPDRSRKY